MDVRALSYGPAVKPVTGPLTTTGDTVVLPISGAGWATAQVKLSVLGNASLSSEVSIDGGTNFFASAYGKRIDAVTANPSVISFQALTPAALATYEFPLPANATHFRIRCVGSGTQFTVTLSAGQVYVPGTPVVAVLYDVSVTAGANNNTGTLDGSGWSAITWVDAVTTATTGQQAIQSVDDTGTGVTIASSASLVVGTYVGALGIGVSMGTGIAPVSGLTQVALPKRFAFALTGATTSAIRLRIEARR